MGRAAGRVSTAAQPAAALLLAAALFLGGCVSDGSARATVNRAAAHAYQAADALDQAAEAIARLQPLGALTDTDFVGAAGEWRSLADDIRRVADTLRSVRSSDGVSYSPVRSPDASVWVLRELASALWDGLRRARAELPPDLAPDAAELLEPVFDATERAARQLDVAAAELDRLAGAPTGRGAGL